MWRIITNWSAGWTIALAVAAITVEPASWAQQQQQGTHLQGQILRADPSTSSVVIRIMDGNKAIEKTYKVETGTIYWGADRKPFFDGLTNKHLKQGTDVWYQLGEGNKQNTIMKFKLYNPDTAKIP
jgi:hypothetical protein